nr:putative glutamine amidotransferase GAT1_2.1 [Tanacetum cinerariifolium]
MGRYCLSLQLHECDISDLKDSKNSFQETISLNAGNIFGAEDNHLNPSPMMTYQKYCFSEIAKIEQRKQKKKHNRMVLFNYTASRGSKGIMNDKSVSQEKKTVRMDHDTYDRHRHAVEIVEESPLHHWFKDSLEDNREIQ